MSKTTHRKARREAEPRDRKRTERAKQETLRRREIRRAKGTASR